MRPDGIELLDRLVREERSALIAIARHEGLGAEDALECVQDALCTLLSRPLDHPDFEAARASVRTITRNAARNARRRHHRERTHLPIEDDLEPMNEANAESLLSHAEDVVRLRACVASLCGVQRSVVLLRLLEEQSGHDVADALGIRRGHLDVLVHRARAALGICMRADHAAARRL
jgi:RNA polymerase sigma-70 factor (ECF subfamily)